MTKRAQYLAVYESGRAWADDFIVIKALPNKLDFTRYGFSVAKEIKRAVVRNRVRRLLKEIVRVVLVRPGWDIVFIARSRAADADYHRIRSSVNRLLSRANLLMDKDEGIRTGAN